MLSALENVFNTSLKMTSEVIDAVRNQDFGDQNQTDLSPTTRSGSPGAQSDWSTLYPWILPWASVGGRVTKFTSSSATEDLTLIQKVRDILQARHEDLNLWADLLPIKEGRILAEFDAYCLGKYIHEVQQRDEEMLKLVKKVTSVMLQHSTCSQIAYLCSNPNSISPFSPPPTSSREYVERCRDEATRHAKGGGTYTAMVNWIPVVVKEFSFWSYTVSKRQFFLSSPATLPKLNHLLYQRGELCKSVYLQPPPVEVGCSLMLNGVLMQFNFSDGFSKLLPAIIDIIKDSSVATCYPSLTNTDLHEYDDYNGRICDILLIEGTAVLVRIGIILRLCSEEFRSLLLEEQLFLQNDGKRQNIATENLSQPVTINTDKEGCMHLYYNSVAESAGDLYRVSCTIRIPHFFHTSFLSLATSVILGLHTLSKHSFQGQPLSFCEWLMGTTLGNKQEAKQYLPLWDTCLESSGELSDDRALHITYSVENC